MKTPQLPVPKLAAALGLTNEVWLKREDSHKYGSHKGRSIPLMIEEYRRQGHNNFVVASSGNAALAALLFIQSNNRNKPQDPLRLTILVGQKIDAAKLRRLQDTIHDTHIMIKQIDKPKQTAFQIDARGEAKNLRQSTDDLALVGYEELAAELVKIPNLAAVFVPTSSGTTAEGLYQGFQKLRVNPQIHIVQTDACHPMIKEDIYRPSVAQTSATPPKPPLTKGGSLASAIVDKVAHRKPRVLAILKTSQGAGWVASNKDIQEAQQLIKQTAGFTISPNSALAVVGLKQAIAAGWSWAGTVACLLTGD